MVKDAVRTTEESVDAKMAEMYAATEPLAHHADAINASAHLTIKGRGFASG